MHALRRAEDYEAKAKVLEADGFYIQARGYKQRAGIIRTLMED